MGWDIKYWRYGDTSSRIKNQIDFYTTILEEINKKEKNGSWITEKELFQYLLDLGIKKSSEANIKHDIGLMLKTLKWLDLAKITNDKIQLTKRGKKLVDLENNPISKEEQEVAMFLDLGKGLTFRLFNVFLNDDISERKNYEEFKIIPMRFFWTKRKFTKNDIKKLMIQKEYSMSIKISDLINPIDKICFRKSTKKTKVYQDLLIELSKENRNIKNIVESILSVGGKVGVSYKILKNLCIHFCKIEFEKYKKITNKILCENSELIISKLSLVSTNNINERILIEQLKINLDEFFDLTMRWFMNFEILHLENFNQYHFNDKFEYVKEFFEEKKTNFFSLEKIDLIDNIKCFHNFLFNIKKVNLKDYKNKIPEKMPLSIDEINEGLNFFEKNNFSLGTKNFLEWRKKKKFSEGTTNATIFEWLIITKIWYILDGKNISNFIKSINTTLYMTTLLPKVHACGGQADARFLIDDDFVLNIEPTLMKSEMEILKNESWSILKHLEDVEIGKKKALLCLTIENNDIVKIESKLKSTLKSHVYDLIKPINISSLMNLQKKNELLNYIFKNN